MKDFINIAKNYIGAREGGVTHHRIIDKYNSQKPLPRGYRVSYNDSWCATFVSVILIEAGCKGYSECSAQRLRKQMTGKEIKGKGQRNDIIFYDWNSDTWSDHVGIIESYNEKTGCYTVIEGNYHDSVRRRNIKWNSSNIQSIYRIYYEEKKTKSTVRTVKKITKKLITDIVAGKYGNGDTRRKKIEALGYDYEKVQKKVNEYLKG